MIQAEFIGRKWEVSEKVSKTLSALGLAYELDYEEKENTNGKNQVIISGVKMQALNIAYTAVTAYGANPIEEFNAWYKLRGKKGYLFVGGEQYGADMFILKSVSMKADTVYNNGAVLTGEITLSLGQDSANSKTNKKKAEKIHPVKKRVEAHEKKNAVTERVVTGSVTSGTDVKPTPVEKRVLLEG